MPVVERAANRIVIHSEFREKELVRQVPGVRWDSEQRVWTLPLSWAACVQLRGVFGAELQVGPELAAWSRNEKATRVDPCLALREAEDADIQSHPDLYPFQRAGVKFLATARAALIGDDMGLGKSAQAILALEQIGDGAYPALVVSPNSMKLPWAEEQFARWAPNRTVAVCGSTAGQRRKAIARVASGEADVLVINWEALRQHTRLAGYGSLTLTDAEKLPKELNEIWFRSVVADEAHKAKDPRAKQTRALWWLGDHAENRFALTGTPVANSPEDAWSLLRFASPEEFPFKTQFVDRYALQSWSPHGFLQVVGLKAETRDEFFRIVDPRFIRRLKAAVLPQLPAKTYSTRTVELGTKQRKAYDQMRKEMIAELDGGYLMASNPLVRMTRLVQLASALGEVDDEGNLKLAAPSCKVDAMEEIAAELGGAKCVVFSQSVQLADLVSTMLGNAGYRHAQVTGNVTGPQRQENVRSFQDGNTQFLVVTLGAGGEGLTLTAASVAVFLQRSFSLVQNMQAEDRIHRIGQEASHVEIIDVVARDTVESRVHEARKEKAEMLEEFVRDEATLRAWLA